MLASRRHKPGKDVPRRRHLSTPRYPLADCEFTR
ncbi:UNVERIFIED_ORG: hypothetical protein J2W19_000601 [Shinella zoogloeoides]|nr:hypothetical protein [Shinella zoogloeoides]